LAKSLAKRVGKELGEIGKAEVEVEIDTDMVEEKLEIRGGGERGGE
jgi:hypothetical protein